MNQRLLYFGRAQVPVKLEIEYTYDSVENWLTGSIHWSIELDSVKVVKEERKREAMRFFSNRLLNDIKEELAENDKNDYEDYMRYRKYGL